MVSPLQVRYLRSQMQLFTVMANGNRLDITETLCLLMPLDLVLTIAEDADLLPLESRTWDPNLRPLLMMRGPFAAAPAAPRAPPTVSA